MRSRFIAALIVVGAPASCVLDWDALRGTDGGDVDASPIDAAQDDGLDEAPVVDASDASDAAPPCVLQLLVNEVEADGIQGPSDEFVELRNGASCGGSLLNWGLRYSSAGGSSPSQLWTGQAGDTIAANGYVVLGGFAYQGPVLGRISADLNGSLAKGGGGVGLFAPDGTYTDGVAYETITADAGAHPFIRPADAGAASGAPNPPKGKSIARTPDGQNTNTNATDFQIATLTPGASN